MIDKESTEFIIAIAFTTAVIMLVVGMYGFHLVLSGKRLRKVQRLAAAAIEFTPAFMTIVFDEHDRVVDLKIQHPAHEEHFRKAFIGKKKQQLSLLPEELRISPGPETDLPSEPEKPKATTSLKTPDGGVLYIKWEMQNFMNDAGHAEFRIARGYDITVELLQTQKKLKALSATSSEWEERERRRIAEDLHDRIGEVMVTARRLLEELKKKSSSLELSQGLEELDGTIREFSRGTHSLISDLVPPALYNVGLAAAVEAYAERYKRQHKLSVCVQDGLRDFRIHHDLAFFLYKAVMEFLRNAVKHGGADEILISLSRTEQTLAVTVEDNGSGFTRADALMPSAEEGFGLFNVKNRAEYYHGDLEAGSSTDLGGAKVTVWVKHSPHQPGGAP